MLEVLVSLLILSVGLLGLASMQISGLKSNHMGYVRTQAAQLAYDMGDRMRANPTATTAGTYNGYTGAAGYTGTGSTSCVGETNVCTPAEMAEFDKESWKSGVTSRTTATYSGSTVSSTQPAGHSKIRLR